MWSSATLTLSTVGGSHAQKRSLPAHNKTFVAIKLTKVENKPWWYWQNLYVILRGQNQRTSKAIFQPPVRKAHCFLIFPKVQLGYATDTGYYVRYQYFSKFQLSTLASKYTRKNECFQIDMTAQFSLFLSLLHKKRIQFWHLQVVAASKTENVGNHMVCFWNSFAEQLE